MPESSLVPERFRVLTRLGWSTVALGIVSYVAGWQLGWVEMMVVAAGCLVALVLAVPFVVGRVSLRLEREIEPERVMVGEPASAVLVARAIATRRSRRVRVDERLGDEVVPIDIPSLAAGNEHTAVYRLPTDRRALVTVGPAEVTRADPLGLMRRRISHAPAGQLWVHPRWTLLRPLPSGFAKDLEGPTSDTSPAGDVAFHTLRPYQLGDDRRHIHWMSTARSGTLMVRHYVDNRRPALAVHLDSDAAVYDEAQFDLAVEITASLLLSMAALQLPVVGRCGSDWLAGRLNPTGRDGLLEALTVVEPATARVRPLAIDTAEMLQSEPGTSAVALVTGGRRAGELLAAVAHLRRRARVIVIVADGSVAPDEPVRSLPGAIVISARDLDGFRAGWDQVAL